MNMLIHKGERYTISADGDVAEKSDGTSLRTMKYYPERDAAAIAGEIDELTAWQILHDIAAEAQESHSPISPEHILIDGPRFRLSPWSSGEDPRLTAPEGYSPVWALAASLFFIYLGCHVFQGLGGKGQRKATPVPTLRACLPELSGIICRSLDYDPSRRPSLKEICDCAVRNIARCRESKNCFPPLKPTATSSLSADEADACWPEEMC